VPEAARDGLDVYYLRIEERAHPDEVLSDYRRRLAWAGAAATLRPSPRGLWLDMFGDAGGKEDTGDKGAGDKGDSPSSTGPSALPPGPSPEGRGGHGRKRSIDVLVSKAVQGVPALREEEMDLVIEILMVEGS
jgi:hypothetical protein